MPENEPLQNLLTELRRGSLTLAVMGCIKNASEPQYGYALLQVLQRHQMDIEANTLYPLLRRLEAHGLLTSDWDTSDSRPRKYYTLSSEGKVMYETLLREWSQLQRNIESIIGKDVQHGE